MKIILISHTAYPDFIGGRERHIHNLACGLSLTDEIVVIAGGKSKNMQTRRIDGYKLITLPMISIRVSKNPLQIYRIIPGISSVLKKEKPDLVHAFEYGSFSTGAACLYAHQKRKPFFLTIYGYQLGNFGLKSGKVVYDYFIGRRLLSQADSIFCPSETQCCEALKIAGSIAIKQKIVLQPNCIPIQNYTQIKQNDKAREQFNVNGKIRILSVTRMLPRKGIKFLILAIEKLIIQYKTHNIKMLLIGPDCGDALNLRKMIKDKNLSEYIELIGALDHEEVKGLLSLSDIFVLPSLYEGLPLALLEAMAAGKAVIFSDLPCAKQVIKHNHNGILVAPGDVEMLSYALKELVENIKLRSFLGGNAKSAISKFDLSCEAENVRQFYKKALSRKQFITSLESCRAADENAS